MSKTIELIFDFVSPNAYLIWQPLQKLAETHGVDIEITPVFLGGMHKLTGNAPPMIRNADVKGKNEYAELEMMRFIDKHNLSKWRMNPNFPFNSIALQRMLAASGSAQRSQMIDALLPGLWEQQLDATDPETISKLLTAAGFNAQELFESTQDPAVKQALIDNTQHAVERGAFGVPTFFVEGEIYFGKERLGQIEQQLSSLC